MSLLKVTWGIQDEMPVMKPQKSLLNLNGVGKRQLKFDAMQEAISDPEQ